ncbi:MAG: hypothetical protein IJG68_01580 [Bacilli bacterium]|nr:hypothetical protein [Bacilli bacterium]
MEKNEKQMEQWNDVKDSKSSGLIIILLLLIIIGLGVFIYFNKDKIFDNKTKEPVEEIEEEVTFSDRELQEYVDYINPISIGPSEKLFEVNQIEAEELSAREKIEYIGDLVFEIQTNSSDYAHSVIKETDVKQAVEKVYGPDCYEKTVFNLGCGDYTYKEDEESYFSQTGCGGMTDIITKNLVTDYNATNKKLEITTTYAFAKPDGIYKEYNNHNVETLLEEYQETDSDTIMEKLTDYIKEHKNELHHITYVFESKDGENYYFKEFTRK